MSDCCSSSECSTDANPTITITCPECGEKSNAVETMTLENLLLLEHIAQIGDKSYNFCKTPFCNVVYFAENSQCFRKPDLRVRVGIKEAEAPVPVCYCFDYTRERIFQEVEETGDSTALPFITDKVKASQCRCEIENPSGRCCLGEVKKTVRKAKEIAEATIE